MIALNIRSVFRREEVRQR